MRTHGTLTKWNDDRGFGFVEPATGSAEIFVHISAFPRDGVRPRVGELISYEVDTRKDGKPQAMRIMRPGATHRPRAQRAAARSKHREHPWASVGVALLLAAIAAYVYFPQRHTTVPAPSQQAALVAPSATRTQLFNCDGRTRCPQMTSCAEATYFLNQCPGTKMDGNHDGVPCQSQWCGASQEAW